MTSSATNQLVVASDSACLQKVHEFVRRSAAEAGFNRTEIGRLVLAADEICSNIVKHTYRFETSHKIALAWHQRTDSALLEIADDSPIPYLPSPSDFDLPTKIKYRQANGFGKYLIRKLVDDVQYETVPGSHNKVSLIKFRGEHAGSKTKEPEGRMNPYDLARSRALSLLTLFEVGDSLSRQLSVEGLLKVFLYAVMGRLTTQPVALLAPPGAAAPFVVVGQTGLSQKIAIRELALPRHGWVVETLWAHRTPFLVDEFRRLKIPGEELETLEELHAALLIPLFVMNRLSGILALGAKRSGQGYSEEDINLVTFLANHVLLLMEATERESGGKVAKSGGELRAATRAAAARLAESCRECNITMDFPEGSALPRVTTDADTLWKVILTLLTHILYLAVEGQTIHVNLETRKNQGALVIRYTGTALVFEKGKSGYNPLIDQMISGGLRLNEYRKAVLSEGGTIEVQAQGDQTTCTLLVHFIA